MDLGSPIGESDDRPAIELQFHPDVGTPLPSYLQHTWAVGRQEFIEHFGVLTMLEARYKFETDAKARMRLREHSDCPSWIKLWNGPFEIEYRDHIDCDRNDNCNCIEGLECPECGACKQFYIRVSTMIQMHDEGSGVHEDLEWDESSDIRCNWCGHCATVKEFRFEQ